MRESEDRGNTSQTQNAKGVLQRGTPSVKKRDALQKETTGVTSQDTENTNWWTEFGQNTILHTTQACEEGVTVEKTIRSVSQSNGKSLQHIPIHIKGYVLIPIASPDRQTDSKTKSKNNKWCGDGERYTAKKQYGHYGDIAGTSIHPWCVGVTDHCINRGHNSNCIQSVIQYIECHCEVSLRSATVESYSTLSLLYYSRNHSLTTNVSICKNRRTQGICEMVLELLSN